MDSRTSIDPSGAENSGSDFKSRRSVRLGVDGQAELRPGERYTIEVKVRDVSASGFMAECAEPVQIGSYVSLDVPGIGRVSAQVRWQIGVRMGGMFVDPISLAQCEWTATKAG